MRITLLPVNTSTEARLVSRLFPGAAFRKSGDPEITSSICRNSISERKSTEIEIEIGKKICNYAFLYLCGVWFES